MTKSIVSTLTMAASAAAVVGLFATTALSASPPAPSQSQGQAQGQIQAQGQLQGQAQSSKNVNRNINQNVNVNQSTSLSSSSSRSSSSAKQSQANQQITNEARPSGVAPGVGMGGFASGPCVGVTTQGGIGVGMPGGASIGVGGGRSELDNECTLREWYRLLISSGRTGLADELLDQSEVIQKLRANRKKADAAPAPATVATAPSPFCYFNPTDRHCKAD